MEAVLACFVVCSSTAPCGVELLLVAEGFFLQRCGLSLFFAKVWLAPFWSSNASSAVNYSIRLTIMAHPRWPRRESCVLVRESVRSVRESA